MFTFIQLPGNFAKIQIDGKTQARVHAINNGTWVSGRGDVFADESAALAWLGAVMPGIVLKAVLS